jgi:integrase/recombinase XerD
MDLYDPQGHDTGCLISEALAPTARSVDLSGKAIVFETIKKRRRGVYRAVTVPESMHDTLNMVTGLTQARARTAQVLERASPWLRGSRHQLRFTAQQALCKWMGHASLEVTAIHANAMGEEQHNFAARMWAST